MEIPENPILPFFAYGVFKPGELAFLQIKGFVNSCSRGAIQGTLLMRDGLPILSLEERQGDVVGSLIQFRAEAGKDAYRHIAALEPDNQYQWKTVVVDDCKANCLVGRSPSKGSAWSPYEWSGRKDPLFNEALEVVTETLEKNIHFGDDLKPLFRLEMAYLLLWTCIERYASLRYHLGDKATKKVMNLAQEPAFGKALAKYVSEKRTVQRADKPTEQCVLIADNPSKAMSYYYQLRSNLVHRGKGVSDDHDRLEKSLRELLAIFKETLVAGFEVSLWDDKN
jgi:hypothetical protein